MCVSPVQIKTSRGRILRVPCNHCIDCDNKRSTKNHLLCQCEGQHYKYVLFTTLSYDRYHVPLARLERGENGYILRNLSERLEGLFENEIIWTGQLSKKDIENLNILFDEKRFKYFPRNVIPYTCSYEAQCFFKRLRYYIGQSTEVPDDEKKIRYFIASEYGPKTFRPHFHALIFTNSDSLQSALPNLISQAWPFGNCPTELSRGYAGQYTSQYTTANSLIPPVHKLSSSIRPHALHSKELGQCKADELSKEVPTLDYEQLNNRFIQSGTKLLPILSSISLESSLFPRCFSFANSTHIQRLCCYKLLDIAKRLFGRGYKLSEYASFFYSFRDCPDILPVQIRWIYAEKERDQKHPLSETTFYSILATSSQFIKNCTSLHLSATEYLLVIEKYYKDKEKHVLFNWYKNREKETFAPEQVIYDYDNIDDGSILRRLKELSYRNCGSMNNSSPIEAANSVKYLCNDLGISLPQLFHRYGKINDMKCNAKLSAAYCKAQIIRDYRLKHKEIQDANGFLDY